MALNRFVYFLNNLLAEIESNSLVTYNITMGSKHVRNKTH